MLLATIVTVSISTQQYDMKRLIFFDTLSSSIFFCNTAQKFIFKTSQRSAATQLRCGVLSLAVKEF